MDAECQLRDKGQAGAICLPQTAGNTIFNVTITMLHLFQMKRLYGGQYHEDPHNHLKISLILCGPFTFPNITQESVRLRLFPFPLTGEATAYLSELPERCITS